MFDRSIRTLRSAVAGLSLAALLAVPAAAADVTVFAAASLKNALDEVATAWKAETGKEAVMSYAASSALAKQIEEGAPADLFISADVPWMDYLVERDLVRKDTVVQLLGNRLVLVAPADADAKIEIGKDFDLLGALGDGRLAMGQVDSVPAGKYGKEALTSLGVWDQVEGHVAQAENVRAALALVATGEAPFGIVYETDANSEKAVKIAGVFPEDSHAPIIYPAAVTAEAKSADAGALMDFLRTEKVSELFTKQGFTVLSAH
ncbi:molybdate transport system substrate-binding protein [Amaricoccus macauensis]|uniref:Molybdate transport system substrate-binding protein n=1 Tax=Amaricoccus macauensis TaxID=57001 RepID=A0A840SNZ6_9RHOB|nr:molybdate ABC transporter substrate-binding protein [Amaricoccus macauensis]MBB5222315.1 molybdate transport system substrate-binding protein [Amaricoccus macauensis]